MSNRFLSASLIPRVLSALAAVAVLFFVAWKYDSFGLQIFVGIIMVLMMREFVRMGLAPLAPPKRLLAWYFAVALILFGALFDLHDLLMLLGISVSLFWAGGIWISRNRMENASLLAFLSRGLVGLVLCVIFPYFEIQLLGLPNGREWFLVHLAIVFGGDVMAYFTGIGFGDSKLMPQISPKKTVAGAWGGIGGSVLFGAVFTKFLLPDVSLWQVSLLAIVIGFVAQMGDLFLSLIKRVANVKDSGHLLPGHGGILDRIDGVVMTCPLIFSAALLSETVLSR